MIWYMRIYMFWRFVSSEHLQGGSLQGLYYQKPQSSNPPQGNVSQALQFWNYQIWKINKMNWNFGMKFGNFLLSWSLVALHYGRNHCGCCNYGQIHLSGIKWHPVPISCYMFCSYHMCKKESIFGCHPMALPTALTISVTAHKYTKKQTVGRSKEKVSST